MAGGSPIPRPATAAGPLADRGTADGPEPVARARPHEIRASGAPEASASFLPELAGRFGVRSSFLKGTIHAFSTLALLAGLITTSANASTHLPPITEGGIYPIGETILCDTEDQIRAVLDAYAADPTAGNAMLGKFARTPNGDGEPACAYMRQPGRYIVTDISDPVYAISFEGDTHHVRAVAVQYARDTGDPRTGWVVLPVHYLDGQGA